MLEAVIPDLVFTISLKRSTQNLQLSTSWAGRLPHLSGEDRKWLAHGQNDAKDPQRTFVDGRLSPAAGKADMKRLGCAAASASDIGPDQTGVNRSGRG
jgi:hypothetical protein